MTRSNYGPDGLEGTAATVTLGVDPGQTSGLAAWRDDHLCFSRAVDVDPIDPRPRIEALIAALRACNVRLHGNGAIKSPQIVAFACEDQFLGAPTKPKKPGPGAKAKGHGAMFANIGQVVRSGACWQTCASLLGLRILQRVPPQVWRARYAIKGKDAKTKKLQAISIVQTSLYPLGAGPAIDENEAEAILLTLDRHRRRQPDDFRPLQPLAKTWKTP